MGYVLLLLMGR